MKRVFLLSILGLFSLNSAHAGLGLKNFNEIFYSLSVSSGVAADQELLTLFGRVKERLPKNGEVEEYTAPMETATLILAGNFCLKMVAKDSQVSDPAERWAHRSVNFNQSASQMSSTTIESVITEYSHLFWLRDPTTDEVEILNQYFQDLLKDSKVNLVETLSLFCAAVASNIDTIIVN